MSIFFTLGEKQHKKKRKERYTSFYIWSLGTAVIWLQWQNKWNNNGTSQSVEKYRKQNDKKKLTFKRRLSFNL